MIISALNSFVTIVMFGSLILLAFVKLVNPLRINRKGNFFFGLLLLMWASFWLEEISLFAGVNIELSLFAYILHGLQIFTPLLFFLSVKFYSNPNASLQRNDVSHLMIPVLYITLMTINLFSEDKNIVPKPVLITLMLFQALFYVALSFIKIKQHRKKLLSFDSNIQGKDLNWLEYIIIQILIISLIAAVFNILKYETPGLIMNSINLVVVFIISYYSIQQKEIFALNKIQKNKLDYLEESENTNSSKRKLLTDEELVKMKHSLTSVMSHEAPYLDSELNLLKLADIMQVTPHQLSYTINTGFNLNFFQFINQHRVEKAKELLKDNSTDYTILAIAFESGFNSKTSFNTTFKKLTGQTPSEFRNVKDK